MKLGKAPGPDRLSAKYYKTLKEWLIQPLADVCNNILRGEKAPETWKDASITLIPKLEHDRSDVKNYRPISLLNVDYKILANILANRLKKVLTEYIHKDQAGFHGRHMKDNIRNITDILERLEAKRNCKVLLMFIDAEKVFDNISWLFMERNLERIEVGQELLNSIKAIFFEQKAKIIVNNVVSEEIRIEKLTRQGCPLSPLLFISVLKVLLNMLRKEEEVKGIVVGSKQYQFKAFADDLVLTSQDPETSAIKALEMIQEFEQVAGFKLNKSKTKVLDKNLDNNERRIFIEKTGLTFLKKVKYLGVKLTAKNLKLYKDNYVKEWNKIKINLEIWTNLKLSLMGRISVIKMNVLPKMLFLFQTLPIIDNIKCFKEWQKELSNFIWQEKKPRIKYKLLTDVREREVFPCQI
uniref:Reverse transcriptase domain-containing protein n=1 Tax=Podarcis muralis TaxID=64176 RepID=A0A670JHB3_PODMU